MQAWTDLPLERVYAAIFNSPPGDLDGQKDILATITGSKRYVASGVVRTRQDMPNLPRMSINSRTVGQVFTAAGSWKQHRRVLTPTLPSYVCAGERGTRSWWWSAATSARSPGGWVTTMWRHADSPRRAVRGRLA